MVLGTVRESGQVVVPREIVDAADFEAGDVVSFEVIAPDTIQIRVVHDLTFEQLLDQYRIEDELTEATEGGSTQPRDAVEEIDLPILTLDELFEQYRIEGPVDLEADRDAWHDEAAKDVFGERPDRWPA